MDKKNEILRIFSIRLRKLFFELNLNFYNLQEVRLRINRPLLLVYDNEEYFLSEDSSLTKYAEKGFIVSGKEIRETMEYVSNYSLYAYEDELRQGFITIQGGHRIGIAGKVILEKGSIKTIKYISFVNIRFAHEVKGCSIPILPYIKKGQDIYHTLIISPPRCGKTTLLRDIILHLSDEFNIGVVDERSEIGACYLGIPQNDLGIRTDILDCCPKTEGMMLLIRSMSPDIIAVDEIGTTQDYQAILQALHCGCKVIATIHGDSLEDVREKPFGGIFERFIILDRMYEIGHVSGIYNESGETICSLR
ncbi:MAG: stage III sporulation protein AA [Velocimicrobium sp.]